MGSSVVALSNIRDWQGELCAACDAGRERLLAAKKATGSALVWCLVCVLFTIGLRRDEIPFMPDVKAANAWIRDGGFVALMKSSLGKDIGGPETKRKRAHAALVAVFGPVSWDAFDDDFCPSMSGFLAERPEHRTPLRVQLDTALEGVRQGREVSTAVTEFLAGVESHLLDSLDRFRKALTGQSSAALEPAPPPPQKKRPASRAPAQRKGKAARVSGARNDADSAANEPAPVGDQVNF